MGVKPERNRGYGEELYLAEYYGESGRVKI